MPESEEHSNLVGINALACSPSIAGYVPDTYVMLNERGKVVIGEAKRLRDLETAHTEAQVTAFLERCGMAEGSSLLLAVP